MSTQVPTRHRFIVFAAFLVAGAFIVPGAQQALESNTNDVMDWLPAGFEETHNLEEFSRHFGTEEFLMASWPGCTLDDERLAELAAELRKPSETSSDVPFFANVRTARELYEQMQAPPLELSPGRAIERLKGRVIGPDGKTASLVMTVAEGANRHRAVAFVYQCVDRVPGLSPQQVRLAGTTIDGVAIDEASQASLPAITAMSFAVCTLLMYAVFRCWSTTLIVFVVAFFNQQATLAAVYYSGWHMDSVLLMAPTLVFVISISSGVHLVNYYRHVVRQGGLSGAPLRALRHGWVPCLLSAGTTSLGIASLLASHLVPIQKFGLYASTMVLVGTGVLFLILPCFLEQWPSRSWPARLRRRPTGTNPIDSIWDGLSSTVARFRLPIMLLAVAGVTIGGWGVSKVQSTARLHDMFSSEARVVKDYNWLEKRIGPLVPIEVVVKLPPLPASPESYEMPMLERLQLLRQVEAAVRETEGIDTVASALTFAPPVPRGRVQGLRLLQRLRVTALDRRLTKDIEEFVDLGYLSLLDAGGKVAVDSAASPMPDNPLDRDSNNEDDASGDKNSSNDEVAGTHWWRVSGRVAASQRHDYRQVLREANQRVAELLESQSEFPHASAVFSGALPLVQKAQEQMLKDLFNSFATAFLVIASAIIIMMLGWSIPEVLAAGTSGRRVRILGRRIAAGLVLMLPNVFPCVAVFGAMGLMGIQIEVGTVMTATVAMGIAVDDTVHYVTWFRRGIAEGLPQSEAVKLAYRRCGTAMSQTSLIVGLGMLVYAVSDFIPIQRFALLMFTTLMVALLADLTITPSILFSRLGRLFLGTAQK